MSPAARAAAWTIELAARGPVPDVLLRAAIRRRLRDTVAEARASGAATPAGRAAFHARLECDDDAAGVSRRAAPEEPPASFFVPWLGPRMKYSSALWSAGAPDLAAAEEAMLALTCDRAGLADGQAILDLGCGWGAFALYVAERYPRSRVTAVTDSLAQARFVARAAAAAAARGLNAPRVVVADLRRLELAARFDRVVALEALEYARNWPELFARVRGWLAPGGLLFAEILSCRDWGTTWGPGEPGAWLGRGILAGAMMPDDDLLAACGRDLVEERRWIVPGLDLARTAEAWRERLDHAARTRPAHRGRLARRWRLLLLVLGAMFAHDEGRLWRALHVVARPRATPAT